MIKRIVFFAHYDRDNIIDDYVLHYLKNLKTICDKIIFVSDSNLPKKECDKLKKLATIASAKHHGEYDFGSWKKCFQKTRKELEKYNELILVNDSCFAPFHSFKNIFNNMTKKNLDVWGMNWAMNKKQPYLDSSFLVLKKKLFEKNLFKNFILSAKKEKNIQDIMQKYEFEFSRILIKNNFNFNAYIPIKKNHLRSIDSYTNKAFYEIKNKNFPLLKTKIFKKNNYDVGNLKEKIQSLSLLYPIKLLEKYVERICGTKNPKHFFLPYSRFRWQFLHRYLLQISGKYTKSKKWFRLSFRILSLPIFRFWIPVLKGEKYEESN